MGNEVSCKWCDKGDQPTVLDRDGTFSSISGQPGLWAHDYDDCWWPCQRKAAEEHAEVERLQAIISKAITWYQSFGGFREGHEDLGHVATEEAEDSLIEALRAEEDRREAAEAAEGEEQMNQEADEYLVKHGFSRKTVQILRPSVIELLVPLLADVERLREELEGERLWIKEGKKLHYAQKDEIKRLQAHIESLMHPEKTLMLTKHPGWI